ncbi:hypothetical protein ACO22_07467 [Paracoccidioides brasiliensis]|uniref:Uncharacterized protein n=1 Tax=Paracoccidioides brasiliensis TaxID=121759 RepID=A0A1D2J4M5_PARBR|nr:hypothetical protein ACO22_07467 [Paracoccidioides brasiliensis]
MKSLHALFAAAAFLPSLSLAVSSGQSQDIPQRPSWDYCSLNLYCHTDVDCRNTVDCRQKAWKLEKLENTRLNIIIVFIRTMIGGLSSAVYFSTHIPAGHGNYSEEEQELTDAKDIMVSSPNINQSMGRE